MESETSYLLMFNEFNKSPIYPIIDFEDLINLI